MSPTFPENLKEKKKIMNFFTNFYVHPCHSKKLVGKKKCVGKFDFITGGWVGPDVLLGE